jgi:hypothetical protein
MAQYKRVDDAIIIKFRAMEIALAKIRSEAGV